MYLLSLIEFCKYFVRFLGPPSYHVTLNNIIINIINNNPLIKLLFIMTKLTGSSIDDIGGGGVGGCGCGLAC